MTAGTWASGRGHWGLGAGVDLSGGQWRKLVLGRGVMRTGPLLIVFDKPTAAIDALTEQALFERFSHGTQEGQNREAITLPFRAYR